MVMSIKHFELEAASSLTDGGDREPLQHASGCTRRLPMALEEKTVEMQLEAEQKEHAASPRTPVDHILVRLFSQSDGFYAQNAVFCAKI